MSLFLNTTTRLVIFWDFHTLYVHYCEIIAKIHEEKQQTNINKSKAELGKGYIFQHLTKIVQHDILGLHRHTQLGILSF